MRSLLLLVSLPALFAQCDGAEPVVTTIPVAQAACVNRVVTVTGVVVLSSRPVGGLWLQDAAGDGNAETTDGIFVFQGAAAPDFPEAGTLLRVTGRAVDFARAGYTGALRQLDIRTATTPLGRLERLGNAPVPAAAVLDPRPANAERHFRARLGMLVSYPMAAVVMPANGFGEYYALRYDRLPPAVRVTDAAPGEGVPLLIDDTGDAFRKRAKTFDLAPPLTGVLHFDFGAYRLMPAADYSLDDGGWTPVAAAAAPPGTLRIASMNVERLVPTATAAAQELKLTKLARVIRDVLASPEIVAVQEVGSAELLAELGRRAGGYEALWVKSCDFSGIAVGVLWKASAVTKSNARQWQDEAPEFRNGRCTLEDGRQFTQFLFDRPSLAVDFAAGAFEFTLVVNHWRSQIGGNEAERLAGARFIAREVERLGARPAVVVGDFNDTETSASLNALAGLDNLTLRVPPEDRYSLLFEGRSQAFDHLLLSPALRSRAPAFGYTHHNADFPIDGNAANAGSPVRAADHDVPWVTLRLR